MSLHQCPACDATVATNSTSAGAFELPPTLYCVHEETGEKHEMDVIDENARVSI